MLRRWFERFRRALANRLLVSSAPRPPLRWRLRTWSFNHAAEHARLQFEHRAGLYRMFAGDGDPGRRTTAFPALSNVGYSRYPGMRALPKSTPANIRMFAESPPVRRAISKVRDMVLPLQWKVQPRDGVLEDGAEMPAEMAGRIKKAESSFRKPNDQESWHLFLSRLIEDMLCGFGYAETHEWPGGERPFLMWSVDGSSMRINPNWKGDDEAEDTDADYRYVQVPGLGTVDIPAAYYTPLKDREVLHVLLNPRTHTPFGFGPVEVAYALTNAFLGAMDSRERKESNEIAEILVSLGVKATPDEVDRFRFYWEAFIEGYGKTPIIGGMEDPKVLPLRASPNVDIGWPEFLLRIIGISFNLSPLTMGLERDVNRSTSDTMNTNEFTAAALPLIAALEDAFTHHCLEKMMGWTDLEFKAVIVQGDQLQQAQVVQILGESDVLSRNELREMVGYAKDPDPKSDLSLTYYRAGANSALPGGAMPDDRAALEDFADEDLPPEALAAAARRGVARGYQGFLQDAATIVRLSRRRRGEVLSIPVADPRLAGLVQRALDEMN